MKSENLVDTITIGKILSKARIDAGLSEEDVARRLFLSKKIIVALESDNYADIISSTYVRGYLRAYAQLLNIDEEEILKKFDTNKAVQPTFTTPAQDITVDEDIKQNQIMRYLTYAVLGLLLLLVFIWSVSKRSSGNEIKTPISPNVHPTTPNATPFVDSDSLPFSNGTVNTTAVDKELMYQTEKSNQVSSVNDSSILDKVDVVNGSATNTTDTNQNVIEVPQQKTIYSKAINEKSTVSSKKIIGVAPRSTTAAAILAAPKEVRSAEENVNNEVAPTVVKSVFPAMPVKTKVRNHHANIKTNVPVLAPTAAPATIQAVPNITIVDANAVNTTAANTTLEANAPHLTNSKSNIIYRPVTQ